MTVQIFRTPLDPLDVILHSPDGESRGLLFRVGDVFPMLPTKHILSAPATPASGSRPWGLRHLVLPQATSGTHEGQSRPTSASNPDGTAPEEVGTD